MFWTLVRIALRNLQAHKVKTAVVGLLLTFGTVLVLLGSSLLASLERSMADSIITSLSGHLQISQADAKDKLVLFPSPMDGNDIGQIAEFPRVRTELEAIPGVSAVIPMGIDYAFIFGGNVADIKLAELREAIKKGDAGRVVTLRDHVRRIVGILAKELGDVRAVTDVERASKDLLEGIANVDKANTPEFWAGWDTQRDAMLEFLENKVAPWATGSDMLPLRYIGTDTERFKASFHRFEMVEGVPIPPGARGILFNKLYYEEFIKHKTARRLDKIKDRLADGRTFETDTEIKNFVRQNKTQTKDITYQLDDAAAAQVRAALQRHLATDEADLTALLETFLDVDGSTFAARYALFYEVIAPHLVLYRFRVGDTMTIRAFTKAGYATAVNVTIYGTFRFKALEQSFLAGAVNVMDMMSFRDLYGWLTPDRRAELEKIRAESGAKALDRETAEEALFGDEGAAAPEREATSERQAAFDEFAGVDMTEGGKRFTETLKHQRYSQDEIDGGVVRNAAIILDDIRDLPRVKRQVEEISAAKGLQITALDWRTAAGMIGDFVGVIYAVLFVAILGVFIVAIVIINNSMVMSTMERVREIGTMRAIGMQRRQLLWMFIVESIVLGALFGAVGTLLGSGLVLWLRAIGIPAANETLIFLFGGPRLHPYLSVQSVVLSALLVQVVTIVSTLYPAMMATRITPLEAMQEES